VISQRATAQALQSYGDDHRIGVICFNDEAALGALAAARQAGREEEVVIVGQGADRRVRPEIRRGDSPVIGSTAFMPEQYGEKLVALAQKILAGQVIPPATYIDHVFVDATNIDQFYPE
jgi:ribose transport system substrate-binding protein